MHWVYGFVVICDEEMLAYDEIHLLLFCPAAGREVEHHVQLLPVGFRFLLDRWAQELLGHKGMQVKFFREGAHLLRCRRHQINPREIFVVVAGGYLLSSIKPELS